MIVSSQLFEAYIECSTKCWLRSRAELAAENVYAEWARAQNEVYRQDGLKHLLAILPENECAMGPPAVLFSALSIPGRKPAVP
jgi:hypothetical protein